MAQLSCHLTNEELIGWAAFYELKRDQEEKAQDQARLRKGAQSIGKR